MFIRSENLFFRPAWPEDKARLDRLEVPARHDPLCNAPEGGLVILMPGGGRHGSRLIGTAGFRAGAGGWQPQLWLAAPWRNLGFFDEAEDTLVELATHLPPIGGVAACVPGPLPVAA